MLRLRQQGIESYDGIARIRVLIVNDEEDQLSPQIRFGGFTSPQRGCPGKAGMLDEELADTSLELGIQGRKPINNLCDEVFTLCPAIRLIERVIPRSTEKLFQLLELYGLLCDRAEGCLQSGCPVVPRFQ